MKPPTEWTEALWDSMTHDVSDFVLVLDGEDRITYANRAATHWLGLDRDRSLDAVFPKHIAEERSTLADRVRETGQPLTVDGALKGEATRCAMRPLGGASDRPADVLHTFRPLRLVERGGDQTIPPAMTARAQDWGRLSRLTKREFEVLSLVVSGLTTAQIARHLSRSRRTIDCHRASICHKLGLRNQVELVLAGLQAGLAHHAAGTPDVHVAGRTI